MLGVFNTITIDGTVIYRGNDFTLTREWIYAGEIVTCTGKYCADVVGWRYAPVKIEWDSIPQSQLRALTELSGEAVNMSFQSERNVTITEKVIPQVLTSNATRYTDPDGNAAWTGISLELRFINAHN